MHQPALSAFLQWMDPAHTFDITHATEELRNGPHPLELLCACVVYWYLLSAECVILMSVSVENFHVGASLVFTLSVAGRPSHTVLRGAY